MGAYGSTAYGLIGSGAIGSGSIGSGLMEDGGGGPPTTPVARQTWNAGWRLTAHDPNPFTTELRDFRLRFRNLTGQTVQDFSFGIVQHLASPGTFTVCAGASTGGQDSAAWTTPVGVLVPAAPNGTIVPGYKRVDISLPAPVADGSDILVSLIPPTSSFTAIQGMNTNAWPDFGFSRFAGMSTAIVAANGTWPGGIGDFFGFVPEINFRNLTGNPVIQIAHIGDSIGEQERPIGTTNALSREGFAIRGNQNEIANGRRFWWNSISNGTFTLTNYLDRVSYLITTEWIDTVDVVSIQFPTHNSFPANIAAATAQKAQIDAVATAIRAAGRGVIFTVLTPPSAAHQTADEIDAFLWMKDAYQSEPHVYLDDIVADGSGTAIDTAYSSASSPEPIHINQAGAILQAAALPARTATALAALGYSV